MNDVLSRSPEGMYLFVEFQEALKKCVRDVSVTAIRKEDYHATQGYRALKSAYSDIIGFIADNSDSDISNLLGDDEFAEWIAKVPRDMAVAASKKSKEKC